MPFHRQWLLEDRVILTQFSGDVSLDDISAASIAHEEWLVATNNNVTVHYIIETRSITSYPRDIRQIKAHLTTGMANTEWMLFITDDFFMTYLSEIFGKLLQLKIRRFESVVEAYRFLQEVEDLPTPQHWSDDLDDTVPRV